MARIIKANDIAADPSRRLAGIKLAEVTDEPGRVVLDARDQAARMLAGARRQVMAVELQAEEKGYCDGFNRGRAEGCAAGEKLARRQVRRELARGASALGEFAGQVARGEATIALNGNQDEGKVVAMLTEVAELLAGRHGQEAQASG